MKHRMKWFLGGALGLALAGSAAFGQVTGVFTSNLTGNEAVRASLGSGGMDILVPMYVMRHGVSHTLVATTTTATTVIPNTSGIVTATGAITQWNITLPTAPYNGQTVNINCAGGTVTGITVAATLPAGVAIVGTALTACTSGGTIAQGASFTYDTTNNTWYRYE